MGKFLIIPGLPKTGTTFLYSQLSPLTTHFNTPSLKKEVDYFRRGQSFDEYTSLFTSMDEDKVYLDASPLYADDIIDTFSRVENCLQSQNIYIIFCIRNPFERIYSHYLHDVAQNFHIMGQAAHSLLMPSVLARYLYTTTERIKWLIKKFGQDRVFGFNFSSDNRKCESAIQKIANLDSSWSLDYGTNPAPGFTSPRAYYSKTKDLTITTDTGNTYTLPAGALLIVNRQFSNLHLNISPVIANNVLESQCFVDRSFNAKLLGEDACQRIWADFEQTSALLELELPEYKYQFDSHVSVEIPERILEKLKHTGSIQETVKNIYTNTLTSVGDSIINCPIEPLSLSACMARLERSAKGKDPDGHTPLHYLQIIIERYGPSPYYTELLIKNLLKNGNGSSVIDFLTHYPKGKGLFRPINTSYYIDDYRNYIEAHEYEKIRTLS